MKDVHPDKAAEAYAEANKKGFVLGSNWYIYCEICMCHATTGHGEFHGAYNWHQHTLSASHIKCVAKFAKKHESCARIRKPIPQTKHTLGLTAGVAQPAQSHTIARQLSARLAKLEASARGSESHSHSLPLPPDDGAPPPAAHLHFLPSTMPDGSPLSREAPPITVGGVTYAVVDGRWTHAHTTPSDHSHYDAHDDSDDRRDPDANGPVDGEMTEASQGDGGEFKLALNGDIADMDCDGKEYEDLPAPPDMAAYRATGADAYWDVEDSHSDTRAPPPQPAEGDRSGASTPLVEQLLGSDDDAPMSIGLPARTEQPKREEKRATSPRRQHTRTKPVASPIARVLADIAGPSLSPPELALLQKLAASIAGNKGAAQLQRAIEQSKHSDELPDASKHGSGKESAPVGRDASRSRR